MIYALCFVLILLGLYGVLVRRNIVKIIISLLVMEYGILKERIDLLTDQIKKDQNETTR